MDKTPADICSGVCVSHLLDFLEYKNCHGFQAFVAEPNLAAAPAAGGILQEAVAGDVDGQQRDFLDIIYKVYAEFSTVVFFQR